MAGVDVAAGRTGLARAAIVVLRYPDLDVVESVSAARPVTYPYIPGMLAFRELPVILHAWEHLSRRPDLLVVDGQGIAHPRRLGIAAHLGVVVDVPAIGCAKSRLVGEFNAPGPERGDRTPLTSDGEIIGMVLRTKRQTKPLFISTGHRIGLDTAVDWILRLGQGYRLPEPTRQAHRAVARATT